MRHSQDSGYRTGFTLIELSIVLVIIGLIVGGILVGRDLIQAAQIRATISQLEKYKTAVNTFRTKYNTIPGDMTQDQAVAYGFAPTSRPGSPGAVTHGDGAISFDNTQCSYYCNARMGYETALFWQDLSSAGLIDGNFNSATDALVINVNATAIGTYVPAAKIDGAYWFVYGIRSLFNFGALVAGGPNVYVPGHIGMFFHLAGVSSGPSGGGLMAMKDVLTPAQAQNIDTKIDDGIWYEGNVVASDINGGAYAGDFGPSEGNVTSTGTCMGLVINGATQNGYHTYDHPDTPGCQLAFYAGF